MTLARAVTPVADALAGVALIVVLSLAVTPVALAAATEQVMTVLLAVLIDAVTPTALASPGPACSVRGSRAVTPVAVASPGVAVIVTGLPAGGASKNSVAASVGSWSPARRGTRLPALSRPDGRRRQALLTAYPLTTSMMTSGRPVAVLSGVTITMSALSA